MPSCIERSFKMNRDHLIELGPEGGAAGGRLVAAGTPEAIAAEATTTGVHLAGS